MRILFTFVGGRGHFDPLAGVAAGAASAGHEVAFGCGASSVPMAEAAGFRTFAIGRDAGVAPRRTPLRPLDLEREARDLRERFARRAARYRVPHTLDLCAEWRPDVVVRDETDFGTVVAAERLGLPHATVLVIAAGSFVRNAGLGEALGGLRAEHGLPPDPELEMLRRYLVLSPFPPGFPDPQDPLPETAHAFRPDTSSAPASPPPAGSSLPADAPRVYLTLGTIFNTESGDLLARLVEGVRELPVHLVVTVGDAVDPAELGPQPDSVHVARYIPQSSLLPHCDLVVCHGGSGSLMGALAHGLPAVLIPIGADQPWNARRCLELGVAMVLDPMEATARTVKAAVAQMLDDPASRTRAERIRDEITGLPGPHHAVRLLERLASEKRPIRSSE